MRVMITVTIGVAVIVGLTPMLSNLWASDIFKWVDAEGGVHYGDCEAKECDHNAVEIEKLPREATGTSFYSVPMPVDNPRTQVPAEVVKRAEPVENIRISEVSCYSHPAELLGREIELDTDALMLRPLTSTESSHISQIINLYTGSYRVTVGHKTCLGKSREGSHESEQLLSGEVKVEKTKRGSLLINNAELKDLRNNNNVLVKGYWWHIDKAMLSAGEGAPLSGMQARWHVELVKVTANHLMYLTKQRQSNPKGGVGKRKIIITEILKENDNFKFRHYYYLHGILVGKEYWELFN